MSLLKSLLSGRNIVQHTHSRRLFYDWRTRSETIFALATSIQPVKGSPLGIIRVSGSKTTQALQHLTQLDPVRCQDTLTIKERTGKWLQPRQAKLTKIIDPEINELIDIGLVLWFPKPNSYTGEDSCEFHVHGSQAVVKKLISLLGSLDGLRPAEPGEFTRRAVENGKISLMQAESIPELISAKTDQQRKLALRGLTGSTRKKYDKWIDDLIGILAHLEASIDFGEDELIGEQQVVTGCRRKLARLSGDIEQFVAITGRIRDFAQVGARASIVGAPNAGKSTLMNLLCRQEKSIVSDLSGTTRDVIEHSIDLNGHSLTICDTAGLRQPEQLTTGEEFAERNVMQQHNSVEREGIKRALENADKADLLLYIVDASRVGAANDEELASNLIGDLKALGVTTRSKVIHLVMNKLDLSPNLLDYNLESIEEALNNRLDAEQVKISVVSCKTEGNFDTLIERLSGTLDEMQSSLAARAADSELEYANERHLALLRSTHKHLDQASKLEIKNIDEMAQHVREAVDYLSRIVGSVSNEQVFDIIFRDFCIGK